MSSWKLVPFEELYAEPSKNGLTRLKRVRGSGYKMINMGEIFAYNRIRNPPMELVPLNDIEKKKYCVKTGDLIFARQSLVASGAGKCSIVLETPEITTFESHLIRVRLDSQKTDPLFYFYYFNSPQGKGNIQSLVMQVAAAGIRGSELAKLLIPYPHFPTQHKIAAILSTYDDLIENNLRRIHILEEMAQAIYREWFVNFRFPGHEKVQMIDSPLGKIPEGWKAVCVSEAVYLNPKTHAPRDKKKPYVSMKNLCNNSMLITGFEMRANTSGSKFKNFDTLMARITPCIEHGKTGFVQFLPSENDVAIGSTEFIVLRSKKLNPYYVYFLARNEELRQHAIKSMTGASGRQRVQVQCFDEFCFPHPDEDTLEKFASIVGPTFQEIHILSQKNQNLNQTRDVLLPKLISGELDVSDLDIDIEGGEDT